jgi:hypothetical protein
LNQQGDGELGRSSRAKWPGAATEVSAMGAAIWQQF